MKTIKDDRGYNQKFAANKALEVRTERRFNFILEEMKIEPGMNILEIGCGTGEISNLFAQKTKANVLGLDLCVPFIEQARKNYNLSNLKFDVLNFNNPESLNGLQFDYIIGNGILHHLYYNLDEALKNILFLLKPKGKMIFLEPNLLNPYCYLIFTYPHFRKKAFLEPDEMAFTRSFITKKLKASGYTNIDVRYKDFLLPITPNALIKPTIAVGDIVEKIPVLNRLTQSLFIVATKK
jgi:2-polyprenyl-3-methyl-5-hydroxy-6-metoxy-1,4-benzoquinol methylase